MLDHLLAVVILVALPIRGYLTFPAVKRKLAEDPPGIRVRLFRRTMIWQWGLTAITIAVWLGAGRSLVAIGLSWPTGWRGGLAILLGAAIVGLLVTQLRALPGHPQLHATVAAKLDKAAPFMPRTSTERRWFSGVAVTAGVCEEVLFRGFCLAYVAHWVSPLGAVALTSLAFGLGHLYQGIGGALKTGVAGLVAGGLFVLGGSLWVPIVLHVFVDIHGGLVYRVVTRPGYPRSG